MRVALVLKKLHLMIKKLLTTAYLKYKLYFAFKYLSIVCLITNDVFISKNN